MERANPPYVSFGSFITALDEITKVTPGDQIDFEKLAGGAFTTNTSHLTVAFRAFGFIDRENRPTKALRDYISIPESRRPIFKSLLQRAYEPIFRVNADLSKANVRDITLAFQHFYTLRGETLRRSVVFFARAVEYAGIPVSSELLARSSRVDMGTLLDDPDDPALVSRGRRGPALTFTETRATNERASTRTVKLQGGATVTLVSTLDFFSAHKEDRDFVLALVDLLDEYEQRHERGPFTAHEQAPRGIPEGHYVR